MNVTSNQSDSYSSNMANNSGPSGAKESSKQAKPQSEFHNFIADVEDLIKETSTLTGEDLSRAKAKLNARLTEAKASASELGSSIAQRTRDAASMTNDYVNNQPWKAVGTGAVIGLLLGFVLARR